MNVSKNTSSMSGGSSSSTLSKRTQVKAWTLYRFKSNWEYVIISLCSTYTFHNFSGFVIADETVKDASLVHHILCYLLVGLPLNYFLTFMGQYSQLGAIFFKHMSPVGHGVGYAFLFNTFIWCCHYGMLMADFLMYLLACIDPELDWMFCRDNTAGNSSSHCWDSRSHCKKNCVSENVSSSTYIYWKETYMQNPDLNPKVLFVGKPQFVRIVPLCICWSLIYALTSMGINKYREIIHTNFYIASTSFVILLLVCFVTEGAGNGIKLMFRVNLGSLLNVIAWSDALESTMRLLILCHVCHVTYGCYMTSAVTSDILTIFSVFINFIATLIASTIIHASIGITMNEAGVNSTAFKYIWKGGLAPYFTVTPQGLGFMGVPQLWNSMYFLACFLTVINNLITQIDAIERNIADAHSRFRVYRNYMLAAICILGTLLGIAFTGQGSFTIVQRIYNNVMQQIHCFEMLYMIILAFWIYRVQRISDDIHFLQGSQPTKFWKVLWYIMPVIIAIPYFTFTCFAEEKKTREPYVLMHFLTYFIVISPIPIFAIYELFRYLGVHNLVGIIQPEERWGPPDPQERHLRHLFNPRQEVRSRRRNDTCEHNCLLGMKYIKKISAEENQQRYLFVKLLHGKVDEETSRRSRRTSGSSTATDTFLSEEWKEEEEEDTEDI